MIGYLFPENHGLSAWRHGVHRQQPIGREACGLVRQPFKGGHKEAREVVREAEKAAQEDESPFLHAERTRYREGGAIWQ